MYTRVAPTNYFRVSFFVDEYTYFFVDHFYISSLGFYEVWLAQGVGNKKSLIKVKRQFCTKLEQQVK